MLDVVPFVRPSSFPFPPLVNALLLLPYRPSRAKQRPIFVPPINPDRRTSTFPFLLSTPPTRGAVLLLDPVPRKRHSILDVTGSISLPIFRVSPVLAPSRLPIPRRLCLAVISSDHIPIRFSFLHVSGIGSRVIARLRGSYGY